MTKAIPVILLGAALLSACGKKDMLKPADHASLPPKPRTAMVRPTSNDLLTPSSQTRPQRFDELVVKSQELKADRFDMPPPG